MGRSQKEGRDQRKSAAPRGLFHRERTSRSVGEAGHSKMCLVVCGEPLQAGQMSSGDEPTVFWKVFNSLQYVDLSRPSVVLVRRGKVDSLGSMSGGGPLSSLLTSLRLFLSTADV
jgi:hypothetical protein